MVPSPEQSLLRSLVLPKSQAPPKPRQEPSLLQAASQLRVQRSQALLRPRQVPSLPRAESQHRADSQHKEPRSLQLRKLRLQTARNRPSLIHNRMVKSHLPRVRNLMVKAGKSHLLRDRSLMVSKAVRSHQLKVVPTVVRSLLLRVVMARSHPLKTVVRSLLLKAKMLRAKSLPLNHLKMEVISLLPKMVVTNLLLKMAVINLLRPLPRINHRLLTPRLLTRPLLLPRLLLRHSHLLLPRPLLRHSHLPLRRPLLPHSLLLLPKPLSHSRRLRPQQLPRLLLLLHLPRKDQQPSQPTTLIMAIGLHLSSPSSTRPWSTSSLSTGAARRSSTAAACA